MGLLRKKVDDFVAEVDERVDEVKTSAKNTAKNVLNILITSAVVLLCLLIAYLVVSFCVKDVWSKSWLIPVGGMLVYFCGLAVFYAVKNALNNNFATMKGLTYLAIFLGISVAFVLFTVLVDNAIKRSWIIFLFLPVLWSATNLIYCICQNKKSIIGAIKFFLLATSLILYVILGLVGVMAWHPGWLLPVVTLLIVIIISLLSLKSKISGK